MSRLDDLLRDLRVLADPALAEDWRTLVETDIDNGEIAMAVHSMLDVLQRARIAVPQAIVDEVRLLVVDGGLTDEPQAQMLQDDLAAVLVSAAA